MKMKRIEVSFTGTPFIKKRSQELADWIIGVFRISNFIYVLILCSQYKLG